MKKLLVVMLVLTFVLAVTTVALAGTGRNGNNYRTDSGVASGLHNGTYGTTTNKCSFCHAVHNADTTDGYKLLRNNGAGSVLGACNYCHVSGSNSAPLPYAALASTRAEHRVDGNGTQIPDATDTTGPLNDGQLDCKDCHNAAPHNGGGVAGSKMFKDANSNTTLNNVCKRCHDKNYVTTFDGGSHPMTTAYRVGRATDVVDEAGSVNTDECEDCHAAQTNGSTGIFPHKSDAPRFLKSTAGDLNAAGTGGTLDAICTSCHKWSGSGVGIDF